MTKRSVCLGAFLMLVFLPSFGFPNGGNAQDGLQPRSQTVNPLQRRSAGKVSHAAVANWTRMMQSPSAPTTAIGFLSATQTPAGGGTFPSFPAVTGDFNGDGFVDAAAIVNTSKSATPTYNIAVELNNGKGGFTTVLTPTGAVEQDPIFAGNFSGHTNGEDDVLIVHPAAAGLTTTIEAWLSNGDGTFTSAGTYPATKNGFVWASVDASGNVTVADAASPKGNICTLANAGNGKFPTERCNPIVGALNAGSPNGVPGNPVVFADLNGDGFPDFAAASAGNGSTIAPNQIVVYLCSSSSNPCTSYSSPTPLATSDSTYDSCYLGGGDLNGDGKDELISANCLDNNIIIYVNSGTGTFATGVYYAVDNNPIGVTVADVNNDGHNDVVSSCSRSADIKVSLGNGDGTVQNPSVGYITGGSPLVPPLVAAFHGDATKPDVVVPDDEFSFVYLEGYGDGSFRSAVNYYSPPGVGFEAQAVNIASGDFNGDGIPDFVIGNTNSLLNTGITVFISNADRTTLQQGVTYYDSSFAKFSLQYVAVADFDGDGIQDIAATDNYNGVVQVFTGNGKGSFTTSSAAAYPTDSTASNPVGLVVGDFNGDGKPDLAVVNNYGNPASSAKVSILINNGHGFNPAVTYALSNVATEITAADINGDGKLDLVVPLYGVCLPAPQSCPNPGSAVAVLLGNGNGTFTSKPDFQLGATFLDPYYAAVGDLNGDGKVDLAVSIEDQKNFHQGIAVAFGNGDGTFNPPTLLASTMQNPLQDVPLPGYVKILDFNQDGIPDMVYSNSQFATVGILYGSGGGNFYNPVEFPADRWAWGLATVDLNGDGGTDVVVSGNSLDFSGVAVLFNSGGSKATLASSTNPSTPGVATTFTATFASIVKGVTAIPTGKVTFNDGTTALGSATLNSTGVATFSTSTLAAGTHSITAQYSGDINFVPRTSAAVNQTVLASSYALTANPASQTVNPGSPATYKITLTPTNGYNGTVSFPATACGALPSGAACSFSPSSITGSGSTTLTITTTGPTAALIAPPNSTPQKRSLDLWASLSGLGLVGMVLVGDWKSRNRRRLGIVLAILAVVFLITLVGCGGGSSSTTPPPSGGTPAGTSTVQVTVKDTTGASPSNGALKLTLVVN